MILHALRPFIGTERGQVSVGIDREVILLSDTHWYWWFVRDGKTGCEGFVPAEILELPNERLARLNRQMNIHLPSSPLEPAAGAKHKRRKSVHFADFEAPAARGSIDSLASLDYDDSSPLDYDDSSPVDSSDSEESLVSSLDSDRGLSHLQLDDMSAKDDGSEHVLRIRAPQGDLDELDVYSSRAVCT